MLFAAFEFKANMHVHFGGFDFSGHWQLNQYGTWDEMEVTTIQSYTINRNQNEIAIKSFGLVQLWNHESCYAQLVREVRLCDQ